LDGHFDAPVAESIEEVNEYFRSRLNGLLASVEGSEGSRDQVSDFVSEGL